jgi:GAF domain-containing protein
MDAEQSPQELARDLARIEGMLPNPKAATEAVRRLAEVARDLVPSATGAGVSLIDEHGRCSTAAATDEVVDTLDALQYELGEGPCLKAWDTTTLQRVDDTAVDGRWPHWSRPAAEAGIRSVLSVPLVFRGRDLGAMKVYAAAPHAFTEHEERLLELLAGAAATLLGAARAPEDLHQLGSSLKATLESRQNVQLATGMLMERHGIDRRSAHARLVAVSREQGRSPLEVADRVLRGEEPSL